LFLLSFNYSIDMFFLTILTQSPKDLTHSAKQVKKIDLRLNNY